MQKSRTQYKKEVGLTKKLLAIDLLGGKCEKCSENHPLVLDFHHIRDKKFKIGDKLGVMRWSELKPEIEKCKLLCSNCHIIQHSAENSRSLKYKIKLLAICKATKCKHCSFSDPRALEFHHTTNDKLFEISNVINRKLKCSVKTLLDELEKCQILCANCHRIEHAKNWDELLRIAKIKKNTYKEQRTNTNVQEVRALRLKNYGIRKIARVLGRSPSTISELVKRNNIK